MRVGCFPVWLSAETENPWAPQLPAGDFGVQNGSDNGFGPCVFAVQRNACG